MISFRSEGGFLDALMRHHSNAFDSQCMERAFYGQQSGFAHQMTVPDSFGSMIKLQRVGGMSYKSKNLYNGVYTNAYYDASGGLVTSAGAYTSDYIRIDGKTVTFSAELLKSGDVLRIAAFDGGKNLLERVLKSGGFYTYSNPNAVYLRICVFGSNYDHTTMQLEYGDTATEYEPYFEGIRHAAVTEIESIGNNLFGGSVWRDAVIAAGGFSPSGDTVQIAASKIGKFTAPIAFKEGTQYTIVLTGYNYDGLAVSNFRVKYSDGTNGDMYFQAGNTSKQQIVYTTAKGKTVTRIGGSYFNGSTVFYPDECGIFEGVVTADEFSPYIKHTFPIPEEWQALDGYGLGVSEDVHNYIDFDKGQYVQMCDIDGEGNVYPLDKPIITDIARYLTAMTSLNVVSGGTLTFVNEYSQAVPFTVGYKIT